MKQSIVHIAIVVKDYDEAIDFYVNKLKFELVEDTYQPEQDKRWVVVSPPGFKWRDTVIGSRIKTGTRTALLVNQAGGRVFSFSKYPMTSGEIITEWFLRTLNL